MGWGDRLGLQVQPCFVQKSTVTNTFLYNRVEVHIRFCTAEYKYKYVSVQNSTDKDVFVHSRLRLQGCINAHMFMYSRVHEQIR